MVLGRKYHTGVPACLGWNRINSSGNHQPSTPDMTTFALEIRKTCYRTVNGLIVFCARCAIFGQDLLKLGLSFAMRNICARIFPQCAIYAQDSTISSMRNICARFAEDCTYFPNAQYEQDLRKILLMSPMRNICARFAQDCIYFPNVQYKRKICKRLYFSPQCAIYAQDCRHYWKKYVTYHISALNLEWYSLHSYFWIATSFGFFLHKHL